MHIITLHEDYNNTQRLKKAYLLAYTNSRPVGETWNLVKPHAVIHTRDLPASNEPELYNLILPECVLREI